MPFFQTAVLGSPGAGMLAEGDIINHFNGIRVRVTGQGVLRPTLYSMDNVNNQQLATISMLSANNRPAYVKANFKEPRASVRFETTDIDEIFTVSRIIIYHKPLWTMYPG